MPSLEDAFRGRKLPTQVVPLPADADSYQRLSRALAAALWDLEEARQRGAVDTASLVANVEHLQQMLDDAPVVAVKLTALPPPEWESLVGEHPPMPEELAQGYQWHIETFRPALLERATVTDDGNVPNWDALVKAGHLTAGELQGLFDAAVMLNVRGLTIAVGKEH